MVIPDMTNGTSSVPLFIPMAAAFLIPRDPETALAVRKLSAVWEELLKLYGSGRALVEDRELRGLPIRNRPCSMNFCLSASVSVVWANLPTRQCRRYSSWQVSRIRFRTAVLLSIVLIAVMYSFPAAVKAVLLPYLAQGIPSPVPVYEQILFGAAHGWVHGVSGRVATGFVSGHGLMPCRLVAENIEQKPRDRRDPAQFSAKMGSRKSVNARLPPDSPRFPQSAQVTQAIAFPPAFSLPHKPRDTISCPV